MCKGPEAQKFMGHLAVCQQHFRDAVCRARGSGQERLTVWERGFPHNLWQSSLHGSGWMHGILQLKNQNQQLPQNDKNLLSIQKHF